MNKKPIERAHYSEYKRLLELCQSCPDFTRDFFSSPRRTLQSLGFVLDEEACQEAIKVAVGKGDLKMGSQNLYLDLASDISKKLYMELGEKFKIDYFSNEDFKSWYLRQKSRILFESVSLRKNRSLFFSPISFELTDGCSVSCDFCCLAPGKLNGCFRYSENNAKLWKDILKISKEVIGQIAATGTCYFATEPFDNPDYEKFIVDFFNVFGFYPQTTTAKSTQNIGRTKHLMNMLGSKHLASASLRFSVVTKSQLKKIHEEFTPEELKNIDLLLNNPESMFGYIPSGRAFKLQETASGKKFVQKATNICTIGFVVNMVRRSIKLIAPKNPDTINSIGMKVYESINFTDALSFESAIYKLINKWMQQKVPFNKKLYSTISYNRDGNYIVFKGDHIHKSVSISEACFKSFTHIARGYSMSNALKKENLSDFDRIRMMEFVQMFYNEGFIDLFGYSASS